MVQLEDQKVTEADKRSRGIQGSIERIAADHIKDYLDKKLPDDTIEAASMKTMGEYAELLTTRSTPLEFTDEHIRSVQERAHVADLLADVLDMKVSKFPFMPSHPVRSVFAWIASRPGSLKAMDRILITKYPFITGARAIK